MAIRRPFGTSDDSYISTTVLQGYRAATASATVRVVSTMFSRVSIPTATKAQTINIQAAVGLQAGAVVLVSAQSAGSTLTMGTAARMFAGKRRVLATGSYDMGLMYDGNNFRWLGI